MSTPLPVGDDNHCRDLVRNSFVLCIAFWTVPAEDSRLSSSEPMDLSRPTPLKLTELLRLKCLLTRSRVAGMMKVASRSLYSEVILAGGLILMAKPERVSYATFHDLRIRIRWR